MPRFKAADYLLYFFGFLFDIVDSEIISSELLFLLKFVLFVVVFLRSILREGP